MLASCMEVGVVTDAELRAVLLRIKPKARDQLRRLLISDHSNRDQAAELLIRKRTPATDDLADLVDMLTLDADERQQVVRVLGELEASS